MLSLKWKIFIYMIPNIVTSVHASTIDSIYADLGGLVVWYLKKWPGFNSQSGLILPPVNCFQSIINFSIFNKQSCIFALVNFLTEYQIRKYVQLCRIYKFCNFFPSFSLFYAVKCLLVVALALKQLNYIHKKGS